MYMNYFIRHPNSIDKEIFECCLNNTEFKTNIWGHKSITVDEFLQNYSCDNYVIGKLSNTEVTLGFFIIKPYNKDTARFNTDSNYFFYGGIRPILFNRGMGMYLCSAMLCFFFDMHPISNLYANVFITNSRSQRMLRAFGFKPIRKNCDSSTLCICRDEYISSPIYKWMVEKGLFYKFI